MQFVVGVDLSGPANPKHTVAIGFELRGGMLGPAEMQLHDAEDSHIYGSVGMLLNHGSVVVGLDAPLSYNPGGGDRPADRCLRDHLKQNDLHHHASVMPPTMTRMVYLTLRGVVLTRMLERMFDGTDLSIVEVHPGASMALTGAPKEQLIASRHDDAEALSFLAEWLRGQGVPVGSNVQSRHHLDAAACALAARDWVLGRCRWHYVASPPEHPYDFAC